MPAPDNLICLECETPCYTFEWSEDKLVEANCPRCGNEEIEQFVTEEDFDALSEDPGPTTGRRPPPKPSR
jgi:hypothetical protein